MTVIAQFNQLLTAVQSIARELRRANDEAMAWRGASNPPDHSDWVLVQREGGEIVQAMFAPCEPGEEGDDVWVSYSLVTIDEVLHWRPLPKGR